MTAGSARTGQGVALLLLLSSCLGACRESGSDRRAAPPGPAATAAAAGARGRAARAVEQRRLRGEDGRAVPLHPGPRQRRISGRVPDGTVVDVIGTQAHGRWLDVRAPDGTSGWILEKYALPLGAAAPAGAGVGPADAGTAAPAPGVALADLPAGFPPPDATCPAALPHPAARFAEQPAEDAATVDGPRVPAGSLEKLTVVSYNLWELYDGRDGDTYLAGAEHPEAASVDEAHAARRVDALGKAVAGSGADVFVFQEVESAELACAVARTAGPDAGWTCWVGRWGPAEPHPQNVAVASRLAGGTAWRLDPGRGMGQRGVLEVAVDGAPLRIAAVHFKSSMGVVGPEDCGNAAKRMAVAYGLWRRQQGLADTAYLVVGDVNVDPADPAKQGYDRTDDILALAGDEDLVARLLGPAQPADAGHARHGVIDRAFLRPYGTIAAESVRLAEDVPLGGWASDHRPLVVVLDL